MAAGNANFFFGRKMLAESDWSPVEDQNAYGAEVSFGLADWPMHFAIDVLQSSDTWDDSGLHVKGVTRELDFGARTTWKIGRTHPYVGGGLAVVYARLEGSFEGFSAKDDETMVGWWIGGGVFWRVGRALNLGVNARYSRAQVSLFDVNGQGGGTVVGLVVGWGWPAARKLP
jgi:opacity protein-like surface antigen